MRRLLPALLATLCPAQGPVYEVEVLEAFNAGQVSYPECTAHALSGSGYLIGSSTFGSSYSGFLWSPAGGMVRRYAMTDINAGLLAVQANQVLDARTDTVVTTIPPLNTRFTHVNSFAINDAGVVVGGVRRLINNSQPQDHTAFVYDFVQGIRQIPVPDARDAVNINGSGLVVGHIVRLNSTIRQAYVHDLSSGSTVELSLLMPPMPLQPYTPSEVFDVSDRGHVVGEGFSGTAVQGFVWTLASGITWLPGLDGGSVQRVHPRGVNSDGVVVGHAMNGSNEWRAFRWDPNNGMLDLNGLGEVPGGLVFSHARRISDAGWIVGYGSGPGWTPPKGVLLRQRVCQPNVGSAGPGIATLDVCGLPLDAGNHADVRILGAVPNGLAVLALGLQRGDVPVLAGTLVPWPVLFTIGLTADASGRCEVPDLIPGSGGPLPIWAQAAVLDGTLPGGVGFTNALRLDLLP